MKWQSYHSFMFNLKKYKTKGKCSLYHFWIPEIFFKKKHLNFNKESSSLLHCSCWNRFLAHSLFRLPTSFWLSFYLFDRLLIFAMAEVQFFIFFIIAKISIYCGTAILVSLNVLFWRMTRVLIEGFGSVIRMIHKGGHQFTRVWRVIKEAFHEGLMSDSRVLQEMGFLDYFTRV